MPKPIDDTDMLVTLAEDIVAGRAETPTGAMRLHGVERGSGQERRLLKKWAVHGDVLVKVVYRARPIMDDGDRMEAAFDRGFQAGHLAGLRDESDARDAAMIAGTSALAQPEAAPVQGCTLGAGAERAAYNRGFMDGIANGKSLERQRRGAEPPSWWERITSRRAKVWE